MTKQTPETDHALKLRKQAEAKLQKKGLHTDVSEKSPDDILELVHELQTHQIELEMQNAQLRETQEELRESRDRYSELYDTAPVGYMTFNQKGTIIDANLTLADMLGLERHLVIKQTVSAFITPDDEDIYYFHRRKLVETKEKQDCALWLTKKNGSLFFVKMECIPIFDDKGNLDQVRSSLTDITDLKRSEDALRESEAKYRSMMEAMDDAVYICSPDFKITYMNPAMVRIIGHDVDDELCYRTIHGLDKKCLWCSHTKVMQGNNTIKEIVSPKNGKTYHVSNSPVFHANGSVSKLSIYRDMTDIRSTEAQLMQAQKMESVGRLAGGVAHDFNNSLSAIIGFSEIVIDETPLSDPRHDSLSEVIRAANRAADTTRQLLTFARKQTITPTIIDLNDSVEATFKMLRRLIGEDIDLSWLPGAGLWQVKMDPTQIDQVLANLCVNARDAIDGVGKIRIETRNVTLNESFCAIHPGFNQGEFILLAVSDTGCGMDKKTLDNIFEPFFTTKEVGKGTGLGMATIYGILKQNNGFIDVKSEPGKGTAIKIYLPRHTGKTFNTIEENTEPIPQGLGETLLVVEDDLSVLKLTRQILEGINYTVLAAATTETAIGYAKEHAGKIDLIVTDVVMPEMNGRDLARELQVLHPDIKCIFMSGYTADIISRRGVLDEGSHFIQKPFARRDLAIVVRQALDG